MSKEEYTPEVGQGLRRNMENIARGILPMPGTRIAIAKLETSDAHPDVQVGATLHGPLKSDIRIGEPLIIDGPNGGSTSPVEKYYADPVMPGYLIVETKNSKYRLAKNISDDFK